MKKIFAYGAITLCGRLFQNRSTNQFSSLYTFLSYCYENDYSLQPPSDTFLRKHQIGLDSSLFARRYWGNIIKILFISSNLSPPRRGKPDPWIINWFFFYFPPGTEMFYFPGFTSLSLTDKDMATLLAMGCPIRTPPDQSSLDSSPTLIAVTPRPSSPFYAKASSIRP